MVHTPNNAQSFHCNSIYISNESNMKSEMKLMWTTHGYNSTVCDNHHTDITETYCWLFILALSVPSAARQIMPAFQTSSKDCGTLSDPRRHQTRGGLKLLIDHLYKTDVEPPSKTTNTNLISNTLSPHQQNITA